MNVQFISVEIMPKTSFSIAKSDIVETINNLSINVFRLSELEEVLEQNRASWRVSKNTATATFLHYLQEHAGLKRVELKFPNRKEIRYVWHNATIYQILMTLKGNPYFTHFTAMSIHHLTEQIPKVIYVNCEGRSIPRADGELEQHGIDLAFNGRGRPSNNITTFKDHKVCLLNGKRTEQLGVIDGKGPDGEYIRVTNVERTLIDITVRPMYSGGASEILRAFRIAKEKDLVSANKLVATLQKLDYIYPYHQAIGFYMERSGVYDNFSLDMLKQFNMKYDFYLIHQMKEHAYSKEWRLFYPKGF